MGNHRLRLSDMMPNAWFCKLNEYMNQPQRNLQPTKKTTNPQAHESPPKHHHLQPLIPNRASYYFPSNSSSSSPLLHPKAFDTHFPLDSPRKSTTHKPPRRIPAIVTSSSSSSSLSFSSSCQASVSDSDSDVQSSHCITKNVSTAHISQLDLPPIITKPATTAKEISTVSTVKPKKAAPATRRLRMRTSPSAKRLVREKKKKKRSGVYSESFAVVKSTSDPRSDFRESMAEMVTENGLSSSSELEDLLACYLSLNSDEYHDVIVEVFEEIWFDNRHHY